MASFTMKSAVCGTPLAQRASTKTTLSRYSTVSSQSCASFWGRPATVVRASAEETSRRAFLSTVVGGAALFMTRGAEAIEIVDDRKVKETGYNLIYEARDYDLPQSTRDGIDQFRGDLSGTKKRVAESLDRLKKNLPESIKKNYWVQGREELRRQLGTLRFDLDTIASSRGDRASQKAARKAADGFFVTVEELDDALRSKNEDAASKAFQKTLATLDTVYLD